MWRLHSKLLRLGILLMLVGSGCATAPKPSSSGYQITIPTLTLFPKAHKCWVNDRENGRREQVDCITVIADDWYAIVMELKTACLANDQTPEQCQAILPPGDPL